MIQLASVISGHQAITVYEANQLYGQTGRFRVLQFADDAVQGALDLKNPRRIVLEYPRALIHLMEHNEPFFRRLFVIGHGIGTIAAHYPDKQVTVAEIDEQVVALSRTYFQYAPDNVLIGDGRQLLAEQADGRFDYIVLDAFTKEGTPRHLSTLEFFRLAKDKLDGRGMLLLNVMGKENGDKGVASVFATLQQAFVHAKAFVLPGEGQSGLRNMVLAASGRPIGYERQAMAGFAEFVPEDGYVIADRRR
ncbi:spermidine synthase [Paenibacillus glycinis]|uniref:spermidine synthase n=1 Tax=Paenibacillus glycinis TaxID=2697035 RepID=UPI002E288871|nr:fused MFS/spermidine synthase [Paenibacillus glycinis]